MKIYMELIERQSGLVRTGFVSTDEEKSKPLPFILTCADSFASDFENEAECILFCNKNIGTLNWGFFSAIKVRFAS